LDMIATWKMEMMTVTGAEWNILLPHTIVSTIAIIAFLLMGFLGATRRITLHKIIVYYLFIPAWLLAYVSGIYLIQTV